MKQATPSPKGRFSAWGDFAPTPMRHLMISGCVLLLSMGTGATAVYWIEIKKAARQPVIHRTDSSTAKIWLRMSVASQRELGDPGWKIWKDCRGRSCGWRGKNEGERKVGMGVGNNHQTFGTEMCLQYLNTYVTFCVFTKSKVVGTMLSAMANTQILVAPNLSISLSLNDHNLNCS